MSWSTLHLCHLGTKAGAIVSADQWCHGVYYPVAALVGWLGLVWARDPGLTEPVGQLRSLNPYWSVLSRWRGSIAHVGQLLPPRENSSSFWQSSRSGSLTGSLTLKLQLLFCAPVHAKQQAGCGIWTLLWSALGGWRRSINHVARQSL